MSDCSISKNMLTLVLNCLTSNIAKRIYLFLVNESVYDVQDALATSQIYSHLKISRQACHQQLKKMLEKGILRKTQQGITSYWYLYQVGNPEVKNFNPKAKYNPTVKPKSPKEAA